MTERAKSPTTNWPNRRLGRYPRRPISPAPGDAPRFYVTEVEAGWSFCFGTEVKVRLTGAEELDPNRMLDLMYRKVALVAIADEEARRG